MPKLGIEVSAEARGALIALGDLGEDVRLGLLDALQETVVEVRSAALASLRRGGSGPVYRSRRGRAHRASAPGMPPASDTGGLARSVKSRLFRSDLKAAVYTGEPLGFWLESGAMNRRTRSGTPNPMRPRPWLVPARDAHADEFEARIARALEGVIDEFNGGG
jgi:hypothetical protein